MRSRADGSGDALYIDIAEVLLGQPMLEQHFTDIFEPCPTQNRRCPARCVDGFDTLHLLQRHQDIVALYQRRKGVPGANHTHMAPAAPVLSYHAREFVDVARHNELAWHALYRPRPVAPALRLRGCHKPWSFLPTKVVLSCKVPGEQEGAEIGHALNVALVQHIDHLLHDQAARLPRPAGQRKADSAGHLRLALPANLFRHQFEQVRQVQFERLGYAFQHFSRWIFLAPLDLANINLRKAGLIPQFFDRQTPDLALLANNLAYDLL